MGAYFTTSNNEASVSYSFANSSINPNILFNTSQGLGSTIIKETSGFKTYSELTNLDTYSDFDTEIWNIMDGEIPNLKTPYEIGSDS